MGSTPMKAAMVVIMMGRKRMTEASKIAAARRHAVAALPLQGEVDHHDGVLLDDAHQHDDAHEGVEGQRQARQFEGDQRAHARRGQAGENGQRVEEALIENPQHDIDDEDRHPSSRPRPWVEFWKAWAVPWKLVSTLAGMPISRSTRLMSAAAWLRVRPGGRLKEMVTAGSWP